MHHLHFNMHQPSKGHTRAWNTMQNQLLEGSYKEAMVFCAFFLHGLRWNSQIIWYSTPDYHITKCTNGIKSQNVGHVSNSNTHYIDMSGTKVVPSYLPITWFKKQMSIGPFIGPLTHSDHTLANTGRLCCSVHDTLTRHMRIWQTYYLSTNTPAFLGMSRVWVQSAAPIYHCLGKVGLLMPSQTLQGSDGHTLHSQ